MASGDEQFWAPLALEMGVEFVCCIIRLQLQRQQKRQVYRALGLRPSIISCPSIRGVKVVCCHISGWHLTH